MEEHYLPSKIGLPQEIQKGIVSVSNSFRSDDLYKKKKDGFLF
jgi:hypothetical protein